ncbi:hypothetical protein ACMD2_21734 [Ananas comosus]|uniref:Uncharacterized protein n=1 Tax=Ananas comosus TaxID=4615 RepID=A0A199V8X8_ANACO|nr:hypothetical protein ACMD2_21734 [Ananas comosus]
MGSRSTTTTTTTMLRRGDLDLGYEDSIKDGLRRIMLQHEIIFKKQVRELHRLYRTQKNLMHELSWKGSDVIMEGSTLEVSKGVWAEQFGNQPKIMIDLRVPANDFSQVEEGSFCNESDAGSAPAKANSVGFSFCSHNVIDLEKPAVSGSNDAAEFVFAAELRAGTSRMNSTGTELNDSDSVPVEDHLIEDFSEPRREHESCHFTPGSNEWKGFPPANLSTEKQKATFRKPLEIDLNIAQDEEDKPVYVLLDPKQPFPSPSTSSSVMHPENVWKDSSGTCPENCESENKKCSKESSLTDQLNSKEIFTEGSEKCFKNLLEGSSCGSNGVHSTSDLRKSMNEKVARAHSEGHRQNSAIFPGNNTKENNLHASVGSTNLPITLPSHLEENQRQHDESEEDTVSSHAVAESGEYQPVNDFNQTADMNQQQAEKLELDDVIPSAAEILLLISSENSTCYAHYSPNNRDIEHDVENDDPEYSADSFERSILNLQETKDDGLSMHATQTENKSRKDLCGFKLRRGRGLRDFQKDILPGLVSLSRHEICKDLHTIEHELGKNKSRSNFTEQPFGSVGTKRSRVYTLRRRR